VKLGGQKLRCGSVRTWDWQGERGPSSYLPTVSVIPKWQTSLPVAGGASLRAFSSAAPGPFPTVSAHRISVAFTSQDHYLALFLSYIWCAEGDEGAVGCYSDGEAYEGESCAVMNGFCCR
jgi:hypothetical protein